MEAKDLLKKVRAIEIKTRQISLQMFGGSYHSKFKGRGMTFTENREYYEGDEIRSINWNVTAKMNAPHTKVFEEERELNALILVDVSGSNSVGSGTQKKKDLITEIAAVFAMSAVQNKDKVGVLFFTDKVEKYIPPGKGKSHVLFIIRELINLEPSSNQTNISKALQFANKMVKKRSILFLLSDFRDEGFHEELRRTKRKHDLTAIQISDHRELELSDVGFTQILDPESGKLIWVNSSSKRARTLYTEKVNGQQTELERQMKKSGINFVQLMTGEPYIKTLTQLFSRS
ncbi:MAG: DUF58 domain-containing protein [Flavobacteriales bacterium]